MRDASRSRDGHGRALAMDHMQAKDGHDHCVKKGWT